MLVHCVLNCSEAKVLVSSLPKSSPKTLSVTVNANEKQENGVSNDD